MEPCEVIENVDQALNFTIDGFPIVLSGEGGNRYVSVTLPVNHEWTTDTDVQYAGLILGVEGDVFVATLETVTRDGKLGRILVQAPFTFEERDVVPSDYPGFYDDDREI